MLLKRNESDDVKEKNSAFMKTLQNKENLKTKEVNRLA
jgi:hypothetical protein